MPLNLVFVVFFHTCKTLGFFHGSHIQNPVIIFIDILKYLYKILTHYLSRLYFICSLWLLQL